MLISFLIKQKREKEKKKFTGKNLSTNFYIWLEYWINIYDKMVKKINSSHYDVLAFLADK